MLTDAVAWDIRLVLYQNLSAGPAVAVGDGTVTLPPRVACAHDVAVSSAETLPVCALAGSTLSWTFAAGASTNCCTLQNGAAVEVMLTCSKPGSRTFAPAA